MSLLRNVASNHVVTSIKESLVSFGKTMAKSKFEYVKYFEQDVKCLPNCWIVIRLDGKGFHRFADIHKFEKPNDRRALELMSRCAASIMEEFREIKVSFGHSDEYSFAFKKNTNVYNRRSDKLLSLVNSLFASSYVFFWKDYFKTQKLYYPPAFDARIVLYPTDENLKDYLSWRQADVHVNNLYNTCFWSLVLKKKMSPKEAEESLRGTLSNEKNELLFQEFRINYNNEPEMFRKGTTLIRRHLKEGDNRPRHVVIPVHCDIIGEAFWKDNPQILNSVRLPHIAHSPDLVMFPVSDRATIEKRLRTISESQTSISETQTTISETPTTISETPTNICETPTDISETPTVISETPTKISETPTDISETPTTISETPKNICETPTDISETPTAISETPTDIPETPTDISETPTAISETPTDIPETPTDISETPTDIPETPTDIPETPTDISETPTDIPETPTDISETPTAISETPTDIPETPTAISETPTNISEAPTNISETPTDISETPTDISETPTNISETPTDISETPTTISETPQNICETPTAISETPTAITETPTDIPETPTAISETPTNISEAPTNISEAPTNISETPTNISETSRTISVNKKSISEA